MAKSRRVEKFAALIRREISELLVDGIRDERINQSMISITNVEVSQDLQYCKIHVSLFGNETNADEVLNGLDAANGFIRGELARRLQMRRAPEITFKLDRTLDKGNSVLNILGQIENQRKSKELQDEL